ncbi:DNA-binding transcriptional regulator YhcF, GntR family [Quadrisphaera granulorum]|uniref:DNA-binding transcriptional regulator YhcF (GntR family) n=1 Tax=Quadrisphaera granulorum TaxID=317664 RepID=A0A315ZXA3_9ACTN|nr:GntR family transcriptional regulator [Quadrisphaera granulorum]PWJ50271.1 DNA-binding transcriptional regulator YhcF (GntR family) [Quadrisphaera granulorum]SZE98037.1 DNA-binding transcriptional regulator YhcF, GntR family [Quadrisphaera granulorum]
MIDDGRPIFQQIADQLADGIAAGAYPEGTQVPSTTELAAFHRINPATVGKGVNLLVERGLLHKRRGLGMFVSDGARDALLADRTARFSDAFVAPLLEEARALGLDLGEVHRLVDERADQRMRRDPAQHEPPQQRHPGPDRERTPL